MSKTVLAIDPGTKMGFALYHEGKITSGTKVLDSKRLEGVGMRMHRMHQFLEETHAKTPLYMILFEEVHRHMGVHAAHMYGGFVMGVLASFAEEHGIQYTGIPVMTIKSFALGAGFKKEKGKGAMIAAAQKMFGKKMSSDNEADSCWILACGLKEHFGIELHEAKKEKV